MKDQTTQILEIVTEERALNASRYQESQKLMRSFAEERALNAGRYQESQKLMRSFTEEQALNASRYQELKTSIDELRGSITGQLNHVFESLSADIAAFSGNHDRLKKRVDLIDKRVKRLEAQSA